MVWVGGSLDHHVDRRSLRSKLIIPFIASLIVQVVTIHPNEGGSGSMRGMRSRISDFS